MLDWSAIETLLFQISAQQIAEFVRCSDPGEIYGLGYFCHNSYGDVFVVANSHEFHERTFADHVQRFGPTDELTFRWDIGNWKWPAGLFRSASAEQQQFDQAWKPVRQWFESELDSGSTEIAERAARRLLSTCVGCLRKLHRTGSLSAFRHLEGLTVMDVDDAPQAALDRKREFDSLLRAH